MKKTITSAIIAAAMAGQAIAAPLHLAESAGAFRVNRGDAQLASAANELVVLMEQDRVVANGTPVRLQGATGESFVIGPTSEATLVDANTLALTKGEVLSNTAAGSETSVEAGTLSVAPIKDSEKAASFAVIAVSENVVRVRNLGETTLTVSDTASEAQVATLGQNDTMTFAKSEAGTWAPHMRSTDAALIMQQQTEGEVAQDVEDDEDRDEIAWWIFPAAIIAVPVLYFGGKQLWDDQLDDLFNDNDDDDSDDRSRPRRRPTSPVVSEEEPPSNGEEPIFVSVTR